MKNIKNNLILTNNCDQILDLQWTTMHHWKDNVHISHLAPWDLKYVQPLGQSCLVKIKGPLCLVGKLSDRSIFSSLSLDDCTGKFGRQLRGAGIVIVWDWKKDGWYANFYAKKSEGKSLSSLLLKLSKTSAFLQLYGFRSK